MSKSGAMAAESIGADRALVAGMCRQSRTAGRCEEEYAGSG
jgi:hypothetical protein